jgi:hypothetical protein
MTEHNSSFDDPGCPRKLGLAKFGIVLPAACLQWLPEFRLRIVHVDVMLLPLLKFLYVIL